MSAELYAKLAKYHAAISDIYEELGNSEVEAEEPAAKPAKGKKAAVEVDEDDLPEPKKAGTAGKAPAKKAPAKKAAVEPDEEEEAGEEAPTEEDVVAAAQALIQANDGSKDKALAIIKKHGGKRVADLDEDVYAEVIAAFQAAMPKKGKKAAADADDDI